MPSAAFRPSSIAVTTRSEPRTASPPAKIFSLLGLELELLFRRGFDTTPLIQIDIKRS